MPAQHFVSAPAVPVDDLWVFTRAEICERLKISDRTLQRLLDSGALRSVGRRGHGRAIRIPASSLRAYIEGVA